MSFSSLRMNYGWWLGKASQEGSFRALRERKSGFSNTSCHTFKQRFPANIQKGLVLKMKSKIESKILLGALRCNYIT